MIKIILAEAKGGRVVCTMIMRRKVLASTTAPTWGKAFEWAAAMVGKDVPVPPGDPTHAED